MSDSQDVCKGSPPKRVSLIGFDDDPFADPYFADLAARHGFKPSMVDWTDFYTAKGGDDREDGGCMPPFNYRTVHHIAQLRYAASLVVYQDHFNYARQGDAYSLHVHTLYPDAVIAALMGRPLSDVVGHPSLRAHAITRIDVDEERKQTTFRSNASTPTPDISI